MVSIKTTLEQAHRALQDANIEHALIGGLALGGRGVHRATLDVDLLIPGAQRDLAKQILAAAGFELRAETDESLHFSGAGPLDLLLAQREHSRRMLERASMLPGLNVKCLLAEDIIGLKIQAYVNEPRRALQDQADIAALIRLHSDLDWTKIREYAELFAEWETVERLRAQHEL